MPKIDEFQIQRAVCIFLTKHARPDVVWWHTPNGGLRGAEEAKRFKQMGVRAGVPDLLLLRQGRLYGLELKQPGGHLSPSQVALHPQLLASGMAGIATVDNLAAARMQLFVWGIVDNPHL
ncbi:MAG: VRR-NUC domain-containing protein [Rhodoplanes sp.]|uniref:VRR-NUC domain-containing protein n=1 Tax=Rhodoplanes sp. TaxID=1968906 RepID=UPI0018168AE9|nr:VRR-NUC domain-containing protein [Rhodoplanes sp.]NVO13832.1 VRR-NUC domain-containing protein [Rhodoplanes sp.]